MIIDIKDYQELLDRFEAKENLEDLQKIRQGGLEVGRLNDFLTEHENAL